MIQQGIPRLIKKRILYGVFRECLIALKFAAVGLTATMVHFTIALSLVTYRDVDPLLANLIAFLCAFGVSFWGNFNWTFNSTTKRQATLIKFFSVSLTAFLLNNVLLVTLLEQSTISKQWAVSIAAMIIPLITFITSRLWVFKGV